MTTLPARLAALLWLALALPPGCNFVSSPIGADHPEDASHDDGAYENHYFGFRLPVPEDWFVAPEETRRHLKEVGNRALAGGNSVLRAELEASSERTHVLLALFEHPPGKPVPSNRNVMIVAENVAHLPGIETSADYLALMANTLGRGAVEIEARGEARTVVLGEREFRTTRFRLPVGGGVFQDYVVRKEGDYGLSVVLSARDEAGLEALWDALARLDWPAV